MRFRAVIPAVSCLAAFLLGYLSVPVDKTPAAKEQDNNIAVVCTTTPAEIKARLALHARSAEPEPEPSEAEEVTPPAPTPAASAPAPAPAPKPQPAPQPAPQYIPDVKPASGITNGIYDNPYLRALAFTGYNVQGSINDGTLFLKGGSAARKYNSRIHYGAGCTGLETVAASGVPSGRAPDIARFQRGGLVCASYVAYVYFNYLPNIEGIDVSGLSVPPLPKSVVYWYSEAAKWIAAGKARSIPFAQNSSGKNFHAGEEIPVGSMIFFREKYGTRNAHISLYAGYANGKHWITHVGNSRGPETIAIDVMATGSMPELVSAVIVPYFAEPKAPELEPAPSEPSEPSEPAEPSEPSTPSQPTDPSQPTEPSEPGDTSSGQGSGSSPEQGNSSEPGGSSQSGSSSSEPGSPSSKRGNSSEAASSS